MSRCQAHSSFYSFGRLLGKAVEKLVLLGDVKHALLAVVRAMRG